MADTKIEWAEKVWNPVTGCTKISPGCANCYAERMSKRFAKEWKLPEDDPFKITWHPERLDEPMHWKKPSRIFVCSMGDLFHRDVPFKWVGDVFKSIAACPRHTFLILTKRPDEMKAFFDFVKPTSGNWALSNVWLGVTVENQEQADKRIPILLQIPAVVRFVSVEPMLGSVKLTEIPVPREFDNRGFHINALTNYDDDHFYNDHPKIDWVICGGESGPGARPMHPDWVRNLWNQCQTYETPFVFKQWGEWEPMFEQPWEKNPGGNNTRIVNHEGGHGFHGAGAMWTKRVGKTAAGRLLDGRLWDEYPKIYSGG